MRIGTENARLTFPFLERGVMPEFGFSALLPRIVGFAAAMEICLTSAELNAEQALARGLLNRIVSAETLHSEAIALAQKLAKLPPLQVRLTRQLLHDNAAEADLNKVLTRERDAFVAMFRAMRAAKASEQKPE
jgi:enoyl-CoA hydratase/carnithine racemase